MGRLLFVDESTVERTDSEEALSDLRTATLQVGNFIADYCVVNSHQHAPISEY